MIFNPNIKKSIGSAGGNAWQSSTIVSIIVAANRANATIVTGGHGWMNRL